MFSGIVEEVGNVVGIKKEGTNLHFIIESNISKESYIDQSIAHNGVCLTVVKKDNRSHTVTAIKESLDLSNLGTLVEGDKINLERCVKANDRIDGHFVQGHVDTTAVCKAIENIDGSWYFTFEFDSKFSAMLVSKGSVCVNGVSLTVVNPTDNTFQIAIIPYTYEHTNFHKFTIGSKVNIEFDIIGKYIHRYLQQQKA